MMPTTMFSDVGSLRSNGPALCLRGLQSSQVGPVDLDLGRGECVCIMGPSGSGKSLLARLIADLDPGHGTALLNGRDRTSWSAPDWRRQVVYQAAEPAWWASKVSAHFAPEALATLPKRLSALGLTDSLVHAQVALLSTGERQRLALLRSLSLTPAVLLLDEPTAALDETSTLATESLVRRCMADGLSVFWITHSHAQASRMAQRRFEMVDRQLRLS